MITDINQARDEMFAMFTAAMQASASGVAIRYQGLELNEPPDPTKPFVRITVNHVDGDQASIAGDGRKRFYTRLGNIIVQCFWPAQAARALSKCGELATIAQMAYQGKQSESCIWFRNCRINEVGKDERGFQQINTVCDFTYDQFL